MTKFFIVAAVLIWFAAGIATAGIAIGATISLSEKPVVASCPGSSTGLQHTEYQLQPAISL